MRTAKFDSVIHKLQTTTDQEGKLLNIDSIIVTQTGNLLRQGHTYHHYFNSDRGLHDLRSISKVITAITVGIAIDRGLTLRGEKLSLETHIWPFLEGRVRITNVRNLDKLRLFKLRHLLNHTCGYADGLLYRKDIQGKDPSTFLEFVLNYEIVYRPGEHFMYSNVGPYLISAVFQEELGINLANMANEFLFRQIGITGFQWENYGKYCAGASGLRLSNEDLHKIGLVLIQNGRYQGSQVVSGRWLDQMRRPQITTPTMFDKTRVFPKSAYGYGLWICRDSTYFCDGNDGQYLIVLPNKGLVITLLAHQADMRPITECLLPLI